MEQKNPMSRVERLHREKVTRYSIRKYSFGAASVAVAALFMFLGNGAVSVQAEEIQGTPVTESAKPQPEKDEPKPAIEAAPALNKTQLESYISEIETKLSNGSYANKTEESVAVLKADLEAAKATLANATTQAELKQAYSKLVTTVNTKLRNKPVEKKETPTVDTTNGQPTVGKKAENTEPKSESNSIENTGSHDPRNDQPIPEGIQFRAPIAYAENANGTAYGNSDTYITSGIKDSSESSTAKDVSSRIMKYKTRFNTDATGKITSVDWMIYYNNYVENFGLSYGIKGKTSRNYIQIPKEVNMPTEIKRVHYLAATKFGRPQNLEGADGLSSVVTFDNPEPGKVGNAPLKKSETFSSDSWNAYTRGYDTLSGNTDYYFKDAASRVPETKAIVEANALEGKRVIWDQSNTGENARDAYVWEFRTTVPDTTTNEQLKDMKAVIGTFRVGAAGVDHGVHTIASNPVNLSKADVTPPTVQTQTVKVGDTPKAENSIANFKDLPAGTKAEFKTPVDTSTSGEKSPEVVVTYPDGSTVSGTVKVIVEEKAAEALAKPVIETDLTGKAKTQTPVVVAANPGATVELFDKDGSSLGTGKADENGVATITPTKDIPAGNVTAKATDPAGNTSDASDAVTATATVVAPTVEVPYSNADKRQIYVYTGENTDLTFTGKDETEVKDLYLRGPGGVSWNNAKDYGFTVGAVTDGAVTNGEGTVSADKRTATIKMTGVTTLKAPNQWTSFIEAKDSDDAKSMTGANYNAETDDAPRQQKPGYVQFVVKSQTDKYDIATPALADKVEVADPAKVTDAELDKIKEKLQLEYNKKNDDANIAKNTAVDKDGKIKSVTKDDKGNLVVTYTDDSTDTKPLSEFVTRDTTAPAKPVVETDLTGKAGTKDPVKVKAEPGSTVELFDKDGSSLGTGKADENGVATITPTKAIPAGNVIAKATDPAGNTSDASEPKVATDTTAPVTPVKPVTPAKTEVKDPEHLTDKEKEAVKDKVEKANPGKNVTVDDKGNATVTDPTTGSSATIPSSDLVEKAKETPETPVKPVTPAKTEVKDPSNLTDAEKAKVAEEVKKSNPTAKDIKVNKDGSVVVTFEDGTTSVIPADKTVKKSDSSVAVNTATNQDSPAQAPAKKAGAKELPNTGTEQSSASLALALLAAATGGLLIAKKREEEE